MNVVTKDPIRMNVDGKNIVSFASSDYLALSQNEVILKAGIDSLKEYSVMGKKPSFYIGKQPFYNHVEEKAREFFSCSASYDTMFISVGYMFGLIALQGLARRFDVAFIDEDSHYNIFDGINTIKKPFYTFKHLDVNHLKRLLDQKLPKGQIPLIITDGIFPITGDIPQLDIYKEIADKYSGWLLVDESHSFGVLGKARGTVHQYKIKLDRVVYGGSSAKGLAAYGGLIIAPNDVISDMRQTPAARGNNTGMSSAAEMTAASLEYILKHPELSSKLEANINRLNQDLESKGYPYPNKLSAVASFKIGDAARMKGIREEFSKNGFFIIYAVYQGSGSEGILRFSVTSEHTFEEIDKVVDLIAKTIPVEELC